MKFIFSARATTKDGKKVRETYLPAGFFLIPISIFLQLTLAKIPLNGWRSLRASHFSPSPPSPLDGSGPSSTRALSGSAAAFLISRPSFGVGSVEAARSSGGGSSVPGRGFATSAADEKWSKSFNGINLVKIRITKAESNSFPGKRVRTGSETRL